VTTTIAYGPHPDQVGDLWLPEGVDDPPVVVSLHGGYFADEYRRDLHEAIAAELVARGFAVWNVEYRRAGAGGFRETTGDVWAAVDALGAVPGPAAGQVAVFGHSAGGYLTEWLAPHPRVGLVVPLAAATDLEGVVRAGWDSGAVADWLGAGPDDDPELYRAADLYRRLPTGTARVLIHGTADDRVGVEQSRSFAAAASGLGDPTELVELEGVGHFEFLDPATPAFEALYRALDRWRRD
jgi:acetyl esterase/lipase